MLVKLLKVIIIFAGLLSALVSSAVAAQGDDYSYALGVGDKVRINIFGEEDLSGEFELDSSGSISLSLIGTVKALGLETRDLEKEIESLYAEGYLVDPRVSIEVVNFRPFFILGEVNKPGSYPYVNGITVLNAIALAGGYTYRARTGKVMIKRDASNRPDQARGKMQYGKIDQSGGKEITAQENDLVKPGDIIRVTERFF